MESNHVHDKQIAKDTRVTLSMTMDQARAVNDMLDLAVRLQMGQFEEIVRYFAHGKMKIRAFGGDAENAGVEEIDRLRALVGDLNAIVRHPPNGSFGIGHVAVGITGHRAYEVQRVLAQAIAIRNTAPSINVDRDGLRVRYTQDPIPVATVSSTDPEYTPAFGSD